MTDPKPSWFQRLLGSDSAASGGPLEEQLARAREVALQLSASLEQERATVAEREQQLEWAEARAHTAEQDFSARLVEVRESLGQRLEETQGLERAHEKALAELEASRAAQQRTTEEKTKLSASLSRQRDENAKLTKALTEATAQARDAKAKANELQRASEALTKELADAKRRLQAVETRASTVEHELAQTKEELASESARLGSARQQRDLAFMIANDLWGALQRTVGDAASLALVMGIDPGHVERSASLTDATLALKRRLEERSLCQDIQVEALDDGMAVELRELQVPRNGAAAQWLMASTARFLEKAAGVDLSIDSAAIGRETLKFRLRTGLGRRTLS